MKHAVHNTITPACRTNGYPERDVARATQARLVEAGAVPATSGFTDWHDHGTAGRDGSPRGAINQSRSRLQVYSAPLIPKRKYEDMTSSRIDEVEPENDHEVSTSKVSFFQGNKRRKPPEAGNLVLMQVQVKVQDQGEDDECRGSQGGSSPTRSGSTSKVVITPEVCGESDLTAENLMAEESSRSSNNDGSSKFESAAESVSKGSIREPRSGSSLGILHSFLDHKEGRREVRLPFIETSAAAAYQKPQARYDHDHIINLHSRRQMEDANESEGVAKLEPASFRPLGSSSEPQSGIHSTSSPDNEKWLQLGVGPSPAAASSRFGPAAAAAVESRRESPPFQQGSTLERPYGKRKAPTLDFQISETREPVSFPPNPTSMAASILWQAQGGTIPHKFEPSVESPSTLNPPYFVSLAKPSLPRTTAVEEIGPNYNLDKDLCLFGSIVSTTAPSPQLVFANIPAPSTRDLRANASERNLENMSVLLAGSIDPRHHADPQGSQLQYPVGAENSNLLLGGVGKSGIFNRAVPSALLSRPGDEVQFRSPQSTAATDHSLQFQGESRQSSLAALMQTSEEQRQAAAVGHSWLPAAPDSAQKLIPLANNFQGWSSDMGANTRAGTGSDQVPIATGRYSNQMDLQLQRASDEWGNLFRRVSPNMLFPSQVQLPDGSSRMLNLVDNNAAAVSQEGHDGMGVFKRAIKMQNRPQAPWTSTEPTNLESVTSWCLNGGKPLPGSRVEKLDILSSAGERPLVSPMLPADRLPMQGRYADIEQILSTKQASQRQSWQPAAAAGQPKLQQQQQGNVNTVRGSRSAPGVSKPRFQVLPPLSRGTSQSGLWFILQSAAAADNQNEEGSLPQITKAYLRIKDGKMPVSAVKKYLVSKLGLASEAEVDITCRGQPVVPNLPLQHVRDVIWYSSVNPSNSKDQTTTTTTTSGGSGGDRDESTTSAYQKVRPVAICNPAMFSKDVVMVLTYRRHPRSMPLPQQQQLNC